MLPKSYGFMANINAAPMEQIFYMAERHWKTHVQHNFKVDCLMAHFDIAKWIRFYHP